MNFKALALISTLTLITSCGPKQPSSPEVVPAPTPDASIFSTWVALDNTEALHGVTEFSYEGYEMNIQYIDQNCDGAFGNSGQVNGVSQGNLLFIGTKHNGILQFGHLKYVGASSPTCRDISKERYTYKIKGNILRLCMVNYPFCADYSLAD